MDDNNGFIIDGSTVIWSMPRLEGSLGGTYTGTFVFRVFLDPIRQLQAGREFRELLGSLSAQASETERELAFSLIQLKHRILKSPPFWSSTLQESGIQGNIGDLNIIGSILDAAIKAEHLYIRKIEKEREEILNRTIKVAEDLLEKQEKEE